jgi:hypothetical protein
VILAVMFLAILALSPAARGGMAADERASTPAPAVGAAVLDEDEDEEMGENAAGGPDLRVVAAAPRLAITGRIGSAMPVARRDRSLNVVEGETVRFISGVKEAVWYVGGGLVESALTLFEIAPGARPAELGHDRLQIAGGAPRIDAGRTHVDVGFPVAGTRTLDARVFVAANPRNGRGMSRTSLVRYTVNVWRHGALGDVTGVLRNEADGSPVAGIRVVALDPATHALLSVAYSNCDGAYDLKRLPPGDYLIAARGARGFTGEFYDNAPDAVAATEVHVNAGSSTSGIDFLLARP